jgi:hypothetical protein
MNCGIKTTWVALVNSLTGNDIALNWTSKIETNQVVAWKDKNVNMALRS